MSAGNKPPAIPQVVDEAGNTPAWVPLAGLFFLALLALMVVVARSHGPADERPQAPAVEKTAETAPTE